jgi:phosphoglucosamine mutase
MRQGGFNLGGEQSGHLVFLDHSTTGDGTLSALQILAVMLTEDRPLSELKKVMERYPQKLVNVPVRQDRRMEEVKEIITLQQALCQRLGATGRMVIRPSGTEPVIRVMVEGADEKLIEETAQEMASNIQKHLLEFDQGLLLMLSQWTSEIPTRFWGYSKAT